MKWIKKLGALPSLGIGVALLVIGLYTLNYLVNRWWPFDVTRIDLVRATAVGQADAASILDAANGEVIFAFLAAVLISVTGLALPLAYVLNKRFGRLADNHTPAAPTSPKFLVTFRQAFAVGLWVSFCLWLQMNRAFGLAVALLVAAVLILFEVLLQLRTRAAQFE